MDGEYIVFIYGRYIMHAPMQFWYPLPGWCYCHFLN